jgi:hypothetical protein
MAPSSFPQEMNRAEMVTMIDFEAILAYFQYFGVLKAVDNLFFKVYKLWIHLNHDYSMGFVIFTP